MRVVLNHCKSGERHEIYSSYEGQLLVTVSVPKDALGGEVPKEIAVNVEIGKPVTSRVQ